MKLNYKEDPKEWRKSTLLAALGVAIVSSLLRWRKHLPVNVWLIILGGLGLVAIRAWLHPRGFRGWYRLSLWLGFYSSRLVGGCVLMLFFIFVITPAGFFLRLAGKDPLQLRRGPNAETYWQAAKAGTPLDRLF